MEKYLITGGAGFIGSTLANRLSKENMVVIVDDLSMGKVSNIVENENVIFIKGSVTDEKLMESILKKTSFDYVFHLAAIASVADSVDRPAETHEVNFSSVLLLLELLRKHGSSLKRLVFSSSAAVYGDEPTLPKQEEAVIRPLTPYAIDKFSAEKYVLAYNNLYGVPTSAVRFFNVYGPNQNPASPYSGVISIIMEQCQKELNGTNGHFKMYGDGTQMRDFIYINDVIEALLTVSQSSQSRGEVYNVGTGITTSLTDLIKIVEDILAIELPISYVEKRNGDIEISYADIQKLENLGFTTNYTIKNGLKEYINSLME